MTSVGRAIQATIAMTLVLALAPLLGLSPVHAFLAGDGKGRPDRDCHIGLDGYSPEDLRPIDSKRFRLGIVCTDCDPACDLDAVDTPNGACTFRIAACVNQPGVPGCDARPIKKVKARARSFEDGRTLDLSGGLPLDGGSACGAFQDFVVPVGRRGTRQGKGKVALATAGPKDKDRFMFVCAPRREGEPCPTTHGPLCTPPGSGDPRKLQLSTGWRTESCGYGGLSIPNPPFGGELRDCADENIGVLGLGCLYLGPGGSLIPGAQTSDPALHVYEIDRVCEDGALMLRGGPGTGDRDCTLGVDDAVRYCVNGSPGTDGSGGCQDDADCLTVCIDGACRNGRPGTNGMGACSVDAECDIDAWRSPCIPRPRCFFGPPLPIKNGGVSVCVQSAYGADSSGVADPATGHMTLTVPLSLHLYITGTEFGAGQPCPVCMDGACTGGPREGLPCTGDGGANATHDCPPFPWQYFGSVDLTLSPFTTEQSALPPDGSIAADGRLCPAQSTPGAFGNADVCRVVAFGEPAPSGFSTTPTPVTLGSAFCVAETGNPLVDGSADLPGPGQFSLPGTVVLLPGDS